MRCAHRHCNKATLGALSAAITEEVASSWYQAGTDGHPSVTPQIFDLEKPGAYSFVKVLRFNGYPMEVGPMARMMVALNRSEHPTNGHRALQQFRGLLNAGVQPGVVARHAARALETLMLCDAMTRWLDTYDALASTEPAIHDILHWDPPVYGTGWGMNEAPRGALGHWVDIQNQTISHYACVVHTTWNASPTTTDGKRGPFEEALIGCSVADTNNPVNVVRVVRSFDPCIACAVHVLDLKRHDTFCFTLA